MGDLDDGAVATGDERGWRGVGSGGVVTGASAVRLLLGSILRCLELGRGVALSRLFTIPRVR